MAKEKEAQKPQISVQPEKKDELTVSILNEKIDLLKSEVAENKLYLELCFIALLVVVFGYFKTDAGQVAIKTGSIIGKMMVGIAVGLYIGVVYFFYSIIRFNDKNKKLIKEKIDKLV